MRSAGVVVCSQAVHHKAQGNRCSANARVGVRLTPYTAGGAGSVPELLNRAISALNFEPGSAGTGHGGWDGVALTTVKRKSAVPLTPQVGEHRLGSSQETRKRLSTHSLLNFYSWREEQHTS